MALFQTSGVSLLHQRLQYLSKRTQILTENIARSDIPGALRKDLKPFRELLRKKSLDTARNPITSDPLNMEIKPTDVKEDKKEIEREMEVLELNHNSLNHQSLVDILSTMHKLYKTAVTKA